MKVLNNMIILPKRDTLKGWKDTKYIPQYKELICVLTPRGKCKWKVGDGKTPFNKLRYTNKISDIQEILMYDSRIEASTEPKFITTRTTKLYLNPFKYIAEVSK